MLPPHTYILDGIPTKFRNRLEGHRSDAEFVFTAEELISETVRYEDVDVLMDIFSLVHAVYVNDQGDRWKSDIWRGGRMLAMADQDGEENYPCQRCESKKEHCFRANTLIE